MEDYEIEHRKYTENDLENIKYFHQEKGNIRRFVKWEFIKASVFEDFPELKRGIEDYEIAKNKLDLIIDSL